MTRKKAKEQIYIDVYTTEDDNEIYFVGDATTKAEEHISSSVCLASGFFTSEDALEDFLGENKKEIEIVHDYRAE